MMTGKERYEERRQQEHNNEMARLKMQNTHYQGEAEVDEVANLAIRAFKAFLTGEATLAVECQQDNSWIVSFVMPKSAAE